MLNRKPLREELIMMAVDCRRLARMSYDDQVRYQLMRIAGEFEREINRPPGSADAAQ